MVWDMGDRLALAARGRRDSPLHETTQQRDDIEVVVDNGTRTTWFHQSPLTKQPQLMGDR